MVRERGEGICRDKAKKMLACLCRRLTRRSLVAFLSQSRAFLGFTLSLPLLLVKSPVLGLLLILWSFSFSLLLFVDAPSTIVELGSDLLEPLLKNRLALL